ncbi:probable calcium-binding protein CML22 [Durio zibethinus]|uniref:Probable calcium-binding protein CML22 n=1 Tax=Durio zibethinus TaxID=66656 RepID=A0A6P5X4F5_DURZI|nr:probable calcium-binding protein CML22 [Durio zibethinus]
MGKYRPCPSPKSLSSRIGGMLCNCGPSNNYKKLDSKLERKMIEIKRSASGQCNFKSIDRIILRFPQFRDGLRNLRSVFEQYDEDSDGTIDREELNKCLEKLQLRLTKEEVEDLFRSCDIDRSEGIQFNEFIVLLCLIYLLMKPSSSPDNLSTMDSPQLEATFGTIVEAFLFLDKNGDGKLNKKDMMKALNEASPWERSSARVSRTRFKEMDWDKNGKVSFREFLFAFIDWVGIESDGETPDTGS